MIMSQKTVLRKLKWVRGVRARDVEGGTRKEHGIERLELGLTSGGRHEGERYPSVARGSVSRRRIKQGSFSYTELYPA